MNDQTLLLIDGHSLAFRAFYALRAENFVTLGGQYTNAVSGFLSTFLKLVGQYEPTHVAVAFDLPGGTFRTREYAEYKGGRAATPAEFAGQIELIQASLDAMGVRWLTFADHEADDIIATLATRGQDAGMRVFVSSGDKDSFQLVSDSCTVLYPMPRSEMEVLDPAGVLAKTGVVPERYQDLAALIGENADNLPGVPGVGPKTGVKWLEKYGDLDGIVAHADEIKGKVGQSLRDNVEQVKLNRRLNELVRDLPLGEDLDELRPLGVDRQTLHELFDTLGFRHLRMRVLSEMPMRDGGQVDAAGPEQSVEVSTGDFGSWLAQADGHGRFAVVLARGEGGECEAVAIADGASAWVGEPLPQLGEFLADGARAKILHGAKEARHALRQAGCELEGVVADTLLSAYLLHPDQRVYDVDDLCVRYLGLDLSADNPDAGTLFDTVAFDAQARRAAALVRLSAAMDEQLAEQGEDGALLQLELAVSTALGAMEEAGIAVDESLLEKLEDDFDGRVEAAARSAYDAIDREVNLSSPKQLQDVLFGQLGLPPTKKTKSGYTTNADALESLAASIAHREDDRAVKGQQFLGSLLAHRDAIKLRQSVEGLRRAVRDGRIHTTYQQTVAATGRLSSTDPNLQNIHARTDEGLHIREAFIPGPGYEELMTADYSQIEMRLMAALSGDEELIAAFREGDDLHTFVAARVFGVPQEAVTPGQRSKIKAMSYGLAYGLSAYGLSKQLRVGVAEAQKLMDDYFARFGNVRAYLASLVDRARRDGYTQTILGRRRYLPDLNSTNRQTREAAERAALNAPIQGSAADIIKLAMVNVVDSLDHAGLRSRVLLQVHDELVLEVAPGEREAVEEIVRRDMEDAVELAVPLSIGIGYGSNWRQAAH
ncbi:MAG: DNA polymerase I [Actinomycetaceae bacterium]|nr:DNA polymerase I [Actinomycetaceae bacterium]